MNSSCGGTATSPAVELTLGAPLAFWFGKMTDMPWRFAGPNILQLSFCCTPVKSGKKQCTLRTSLFWLHLPDTSWCKCSGLQAHWGQQVTWIKIGIVTQRERPAENIRGSIACWKKSKGFCQSVLNLQLSHALLGPCGSFDKHVKHFNTFQLHLSCACYC